MSSDDSSFMPIVDYSEGVTEYDKTVSLLQRITRSRSTSFRFRQCPFEVVYFQARLLENHQGMFPNLRILFTDGLHKAIDQLQCFSRAFNVTSIIAIKCADPDRVISSGTANLLLGALVKALDDEQIVKAVVMSEEGLSMVGVIQGRKVSLSNIPSEDIEQAIDASVSSLIKLQCEADGEVYEWRTECVGMSINEPFDDVPEDGNVASIHSIRLVSANIPHSALTINGALEIFESLNISTNKLWRIKDNKHKSKPVAISEDKSILLETRLAKCFLKVMSGESVRTNLLHRLIHQHDYLQDISCFWLDMVVPYMRDKWESLIALDNDEGGTENNNYGVDMNAPLLIQKIQMVKACIRWKQREQSEEHFYDCNVDDELKREGHKVLVQNKFLLKTHKPMYTPMTQAMGPMTTDWMDVHREAIERVTEIYLNHGNSTDSNISGNKNLRARMQSRQLVSDMQAFKAANPDCILEDFVRWHSPRDWSEGEGLSERMKEGLWRELWDEETTMACPVTKQPKLFDPEREAEKALFWLEDISVKDLLEGMGELLHDTAASILLEKRSHKNDGDDGGGEEEKNRLLDAEKRRILHETILRRHLAIPDTVPQSLLTDIERVVKHLTRYSDSIEIVDPRTITAFKQFMRSHRVYKHDTCIEHFSPFKYMRIENNRVTAQGHVQE